MSQLELLLVAGIICVVIICYVMSKKDCCEHYVNKEEKAETIHQWFKSNPQPSYTKYRSAVPESDIVEYTSVKAVGGAKADKKAIVSVL